jgi:AcrR family transcriptional regulator
LGPTGSTVPVPRWNEYEPLTLDPILTAALEAFQEHGYHGTAVRDIARRVGVTVPAIYYHYDNKQELLAKLLCGGMDELLRRCRQAYGEAGEEPTKRFSALIECLVLWLTYRHDIAILDSEQRHLTSDPPNRKHYIKGRDELEGMLRQTLLAGAASGVFAKSEHAEIGRAVLTMCLGVVDWYKIDGPQTPEQIAARYVEFACKLAAASK